MQTAASFFESWRSITSQTAQRHAIHIRNVIIRGNDPRGICIPDLQELLKKLGFDETGSIEEEYKEFLLFYDHDSL